MKRHWNGVSLAGRRWPNTEFWLNSFVIFQGIRTSIAKKPYIFVIFQGGGPSGSEHVQTDQHSDSVPEQIFWKSWFWKLCFPFRACIYPVLKTGTKFENAVMWPLNHKSLKWASFLLDICKQAASDQVLHCLFTEVSLKILNKIENYHPTTLKLEMHSSNG